MRTKVQAPPRLIPWSAPDGGRERLYIRSSRIPAGVAFWFEPTANGLVCTRAKGGTKTESLRALARQALAALVEAGLLPPVQGEVQYCCWDDLAQAVAAAASLH